MSYTLYPLRKPRLQRSELAVPGSNPTMIEKAAQSAADYVFLDCEDAVAPPDKEQARKNIIQALNDIDWTAAGKTVSVRINGLDTHYMYRDVVDIDGAGRRQARHHPHSQGRRAGRRLHASRASSARSRWPRASPTRSASKR